jgi:hypothetical protein
MPGDSQVLEKMMVLPYGSVVKVKCRLGYEGKNSSVYLRAEEMEEIENVRLVINEM